MDKKLRRNLSAIFYLNVDYIIQGQPLALSIFVIIHKSMDSVKKKKKSLIEISKASGLKIDPCRTCSRNFF